MPDIGWDAMDWRRGSRCFADDSRLITSEGVLHCSVSVSPSMDYVTRTLCVTLKKQKHLIDSVNKVSGNRAIYTFQDIYTRDPVMKKTIALARRYARYDVNILIEGESGTGKELFAQAMHNESSRAEGPFVAINCASIPRDLLERELFGYERGAFTGANREGKMGVFESANKGTVFLDEIGEMAFDLQAKLLRVLESGEFIKVGDTRPFKVNVRIIAATNRDLQKEIEAGHFREDLYYRLSVFRIQLPPLRERIEDIELYVRAFVKMFGPGVGKKIEEITPEYLGTLKKHVWKGNVRELRNVIERSMIIADGAVLTVSDLPFDIQQSVLESEGGKGYSEFDLAQVEKAHIRKVLQYTGGNKTEAARLMHIGLTTLYRKIEEYGIR